MVINLFYKRTRKSTIIIKAVIIHFKFEKIAQIFFLKQGLIDIERCIQDSSLIYGCIVLEGIIKKVKLNSIINAF